MAILEPCGSLIGQVHFDQIKQLRLCAVDLTFSKRHRPMVASATHRAYPFTCTHVGAGNTTVVQLLGIGQTQNYGFHNRKLSG
jgi:hypothetical protein